MLYIAKKYHTRNYNVVDVYADDSASINLKPESRIFSITPKPANYRLHYITALFVNSLV